MIWRTILLSIRLMFDARVSSFSKLLPFIAILYFFSPIDLIPDLTALGMVDDLGVLLAMLNFFIQSAPEDVLRDHLDRMSRHDRVLRMVRNMSPLPNRMPSNQTPSDDDDIIEGRISQKP